VKNVSPIKQELLRGHDTHHFEDLLPNRENELRLSLRANEARRGQLRN
jgi:hypothetical protein